VDVLEIQNQPSILAGHNRVHPIESRREISIPFFLRKLETVEIIAVIPSRSKGEPGN
jgi:hypothetical protein